MSVFNNRRVPKRAPLLALSAFAFACAAAPPPSMRAELAEFDAQLASLDELEGRAAEDVPAPFDGSLGAYLAFAFERNPELRASFEHWRAASYAPDRVRALPEPTITYAGFVRSVETRVGPQQHKLGVMQWFPWPTTLTAAGHAETHRAESAQRHFEALALSIAARVERAYWQLWLIHRLREVESAQVVLLEGLAKQLESRLETGAADLGSLAQVHLSVSQLKDQLEGLEQEQRSAAASLAEAIGAPQGTLTPIEETGPKIARPADERAALLGAARQHPRVQAVASLADAAEDDVRAARAEFAPSFGVGVDWIITGEAVDPAMRDSGKDPVVVMGSIKVPIWARSYRAGVRQAQAQGRAQRARLVAAKNAASADVERQLAAVENSARRVQLYQTTLVPQAESAFESVASSFAAGRAGIAELLMVERDLLQLQVARFEAEAKHAGAWAELERIVGRPVERKVAR